MASSGDSFKYPGPVDFKDNEKDKKSNADHASIFLEVPGLKVNKIPFGDAKPDNAEIVKDFQTGSIAVTITFKDGTGGPYRYQKKLPEDINPDKTTFKVKKDTVILYLCKKERGSWAEHANYFIRPGN